MHVSPIPLINGPQFLISTDGSCDHRDQMSGSSAVVRDLISGDVVCRGACESGSSVRRAELRALLLGLNVVLELSGLHDPGARRQFIEKGAARVRVRWTTDRQDLARSVYDPDGGRLFSRDMDADLWASVAWFEQVFEIESVLVPRNTDPDQTEMDRVCGLLRQAMQACAMDTKWTFQLTLQ